MHPAKKITGFSKLTKEEKLKLVASYCDEPTAFVQSLQNFWHSDAQQQQIFDEFSENTLTNFFLPYGVAPNFLVNGRYYIVPMVTEESSVVAAAAKAAKFWAERGGFKAVVQATTKVGHIHFSWHGDKDRLYELWPALKKALLDNIIQLTERMRQRGGGIKEIDLLDKREVEPGYYQLAVTFNTCDAMGANFINSCLEQLANTLQTVVATHRTEDGEERVEIIMSILSNYTPECIVESEVACPLTQLGPVNGLSPAAFVKKFAQAVKIAQSDLYRAVTHNKGIFNGIDAVAMATGNDFRAIEACGHAYSARKGSYQSLTKLKIEKDIFSYTLTIPLALGVVGGLTKLHPLVKGSLKLLGNPMATTLMKIVASVGLASNFSAVSALVTTGIQQGHMQMHLLNILNQLGASERQKQLALDYFREHKVSFQSVRAFLEKTSQG